MGRYYTVSGDSLYVYVTYGSSLLDLNSLPQGIGIFEAEAGWRLCPWLGFSEGLTNQGLKLVNLLLESEGFVQVDIPLEYLEEYFQDGDDEAIESLISVKNETSVPLLPIAIGYGSIAKPYVRRNMRKRSIRPTPLHETGRSDS